MKELLSKIGDNKNITDKIIADNKDLFDELFLAYQENNLEGYKEKKDISDSNLKKLLKTLKKSKLYKWYFSLEDIRNNSISSLELIRLLKEDVLYNSIDDEFEKYGELSNGLRNMMFNFINLRLNPENSKKMCLEVFKLNEDYSSIISDFFIQNYTALKLDFILQNVRKN